MVPGSAAPPPEAAHGLAPPPLGSDQIVAYIRQTLDWYREAQAIQNLPELAQDVVARDRLQQSALRAVQLAFGFGRAGAALMVGSSQAATKGAHSSPHTPAGIDQAVARAAQRVAALRLEIMQVDAAIARAPARSRASLRARRSSITAALSLEREVESTLEALQRFESSAQDFQARGTRDLLGRIEDLERSVPEARRSPSAPSGGVTVGGVPSSAFRNPPRPTAGVNARGAVPTLAAAGFRPESAGILTLIGEWFSLQSDGRQLGGGIEATGALAKSLDALRAPLLGQARNLVRDDLAGIDTTDPAKLQDARRTFERATARFKQLAGLLVPLGEQQFILDDARSALSEWRDTLHARLATITRLLLTRAALLVALIVLVLIVSEVWRRAVFRYFHDSRRRSQFQTLRRVTIGIALVVIIIFLLVSQIGSLATYVGFLTAGLAVALQNVILAIVAYFFLIGRYGVQIGDRITLAGVTGNVADIGLVRIYLMELAGADLHATGRIVVISNAVLFQPQALYKQIPGADYLWHSIAMTLCDTVDVQAAQERLKSAAHAVYAHYRPALEAQHATMQRLVDFETAVPSPEVRVRFAEMGLKFEVRYPVQSDDSVAIDQKMLKALKAALGQEPPMQIVPSGEPAVENTET